MAAQADEARSGRGRVILLPTVVINADQYRGSLAAPAVLRALCAGFSEGRWAALLWSMQAAAAGRGGGGMEAGRLCGGAVVAVAAVPCAHGRACAGGQPRLCGGAVVAVAAVPCAHARACAGGQELLSWIRGGQDWAGLPPCLEEDFAAVRPATKALAPCMRAAWYSPPPPAPQRAAHLPDRRPQCGRMRRRHRPVLAGRARGAPQRLRGHLPRLRVPLPARQARRGLAAAGGPERGGRACGCWCGLVWLLVWPACPLRCRCLP